MPSKTPKVEGINPTAFNSIQFRNECLGFSNDPYSSKNTVIFRPLKATAYQAEYISDIP